MLSDKVSSLNDSLSPLTGKSVTTANTNLDDYKITGIYYFSSSYTPTNIPVGVNGWIQVFRVSDTTVKQIWYRFGTANSNDTHTFIRTLSGTTWSDWTQIITQKELDDSLAPLIGKNISTANTDLNDYKTTGIYYFASGYVPLNIPIGVNGFLSVMSIGSVVKQLWYRTGTLNSNDANTYVRTFSSGWSEWTQIVTQKEFNALADRVAALEAK